VHKGLTCSQHLKPPEKMTFFFSWMHHHHEGEKTIPFPQIEEFIEEKELLEKNGNGLQ